MPPALYVFEGPDGVGKSSLALRLSQHLDGRGMKNDLLSFPGREARTLGEHIYRLYHEPQSFGIEHIEIATEQVLVTAAHADVVERRIIPAWMNDRNIILDRYWWSTWVYATAGKINPRVRDRLIELELAIWRDIKPTCVFLVRRNEPLKNLLKSERWLQLVSLYNELSGRQSANVKVVIVENNGAIGDAFQVVVDSIDA